MPSRRYVDLMVSVGLGIAVDDVVGHLIIPRGLGSRCGPDCAPSLGRGKGVSRKSMVRAQGA